MSSLSTEPTQPQASVRKAESPAALKDISLLVIGPSMDILGGQAVQVGRLLGILEDVAGLDVTFLPINPRPPAPFLWVLSIRGLRTIVTFAQYIVRLAWTIPRHEVLHIFSAGLTSYALWTVPALLIGRFWRKKIILNYHDGQGDQHLREWRTAKPTVALANRIVTPSGFLVDVFRNHGIEARSIVNIIDTARFVYRKRRKLRPIFMTNRILEPLYNVECILRAFSIIQKSYPDATLTIAHDGCCRPSLEKMARDLKLANTRFIGRVPHERVTELYDAADIYLTSPNIDNMPVSLLECFAAGLPIVATKAGGIPYVATDRESALLVDINDHEALAARSIELLENEELVERITNGGLEAVKRYDPAPVREQWSALYRELAGESRSS
jgi:glycosyltransferase involved in cell wall biosynthesis